MKGIELKKLMLSLLLVVSSTTFAQDRTHTSKGEQLKYVNGQWVWVAPVQVTDPRRADPYSIQTNGLPTTPPPPKGYKYESQWDSTCHCYKTYLVSK